MLGLGNAKEKKDSFKTKDKLNVMLGGNLKLNDVKKLGPGGNNFSFKKLDKNVLT